MSQKARMIKRAPSRKQRQKARKKFGLYDETSASIELLPEGFLGWSAESLYCVYGVSLPLPDVEMYDPSARDWWDLVDSTTVLFMPPAERTTIYGDLPDGVSSVKLRADRTTLHLNIVLSTNGSSATANFIFPSMEIDLASLPEYYQRKSSTYHTAPSRMLSFLKDSRIASLLGSEEMKIATAFAMSNGERSMRVICALASYILLRIQQTVCCHSLLKSEGRTLAKKAIGEDSDVECVNTEDMLWLGTRLPHIKLENDITIPASLRSESYTASSAASRVLGDAGEAFSYFATCNALAAEAELSDSTPGFVRVADVNKASKEGLLLIGANGTPMKTSGGDDLRDAKWAVRPTGLTENDKPLYALFTRSGSGWSGFHIRTMAGVFSYIKKHLGDAYVDSKSAQVLSSRTKPLHGFTLEAWLGGKQSVTEAFMYECAYAMQEDMDHASLLQSAEDISYFLRILIWRARAVGVQDGETINTGLLRSDGKFMYVALHNLYENINFVSVRYLGGREDDKKPLLFYRYTDKLCLRTKEGLTYSDRSLKHVLLDNKLRLGTKLAGTSEVKLLSGLRYSVEDAERRLSANPFYAQPFYDHTHDSIAFFIPFYLERGGEVLAALLVSGNTVRTVYPIEWARQRAVCLGIPLADWLRK